MRNRSDGTESGNRWAGDETPASKELAMCAGGWVEKRAPDQRRWWRFWPRQRSCRPPLQRPSCRARSSPQARGRRGWWRCPERPAGHQLRSVRRRCPLPDTQTLRDAGTHPVGAHPSPLNVPSLSAIHKVERRRAVTGWGESLSAHRVQHVDVDARSQRRVLIHAVTGRVQLVQIPEAGHALRGAREQ